MIPHLRLFVAVAGLCVVVPAFGSRLSAQFRRLSDIERTYDAVVVVLDVRSGRVAASARAGELRDRRWLPGSLVKLAITHAALRRGTGTDLRYTCTGRDTIAGRAEECWNHEGHRTLNLVGAIAHSCNLFFRQLVLQLNEDQIIGSSRQLGLLPVGLEWSGRLTPQTLLGEAWAVSPIDMARVALRLARREGELGSARYRPLYEGLAACVREGTGSAAGGRGLALAGKTGTSPFGTGPDRFVGWFIGFAPVDQPRWVVTVLLRNGRGFEAARIARKALGAMR